MKSAKRIKNGGCEYIIVLYPKPVTAKCCRALPPSEEIDINYTIIFIFLQCSWGLIMYFEIR